GVAGRDEAVAAVDGDGVAHVRQALEIAEVQVSRAVVDDAAVAAARARERGLPERGRLVPDEVEGLAAVLGFPDEARGRREAERRRDVDVVEAAGVPRPRDRQARLARHPLVVDHYRMSERERAARPSGRGRPRSGRAEHRKPDTQYAARRNEPPTPPSPRPHLALLVAADLVPEFPVGGAEKRIRQ